MLLAIAFVFILAALAVVIGLVPNIRKDHAKLFLTAGIPLVISYAFFIMLFSTPDEYTFIHRIFDNRTTGLLDVPAQLPEVYSFDMGYSFIHGWFSEPFDYDTTRQTDFAISGTSVIPFLLPAAIMDIGKALGINGFVMLYVCRLVNGSIFLVAGWWALNRLPFGKTFALVFLLNPLLIQQEIAPSYDSLNNIACICFISEFLYVKAKPKNSGLPVIDVALLLFFIFLIATTKIAYVPFAIFCALLIPVIKRRELRITAIVCVVLICIALPVLIATVPALQKAASSVLGAQLLNAFPSAIATLQVTGVFHLLQFMGGNLGWPYMNDVGTAATAMIPFVWILYTILYVLAFFACSDNEKVLPVASRIVLIVISIFIGIAAYSAISGGTAGAIKWFQSRYLLMPAFCGAFALMPTKHVAISKRLECIQPWIFAMVGMLLALASICAVMIRFYW